MCPSNTYGNPGISRSQICVDFTILPSGKLIVRGFVARRTFFILGVFFMIITEVAPVSATACVMGIDGFLGCTLGAHICWCLLDKLSVITVVSSPSTIMFWVGYKLGSETNEFKHYNSSCSAPHRHILGS